MECSGACGKLFLEKNLKLKISCQTPFQKMALLDSYLAESIIIRSVDSNLGPVLLYIFRRAGLLNFSPQTLSTNLCLGGKKEVCAGVLRREVTANSQGLQASKEISGEQSAGENIAHTSHTGKNIGTIPGDSSRVNDLVYVPGAAVFFSNGTLCCATCEAGG
jgi:hypothetical protein